MIGRALSAARRRRRLRRPSAYELLALALAAFALGGVGYAAIPGVDGRIHGCYDNTTGALRVIDSDAAERCGGNEAALNWNQTGPPGPPGTSGTPGPSGPAGPGSGLQAQEAEEANAAALGQVPALAKKPKKLSLPQLKKLAAAPGGSGVARAAFRDGPVPVGALGRAQGPPQPKTVAALALSAGRWVIHAKAITAPTPKPNGLPNLDSRHAHCRLQAGIDSDDSYSSETLAAQVVHRFTKPGAVELRCIGTPATMLRQIKISSIPVAKLTNQPVGG